MAAFALLAASASTAVISSNWSGYVARSTASVKRFTRVLGVWTEPAATCEAGRPSYSAVWVGLGGYALDARGLEQIGTDVSSAEWIVEAPSVCTTSCRTLTLADFGTAAFSTATARSATGTYSLLDGPWARTELLLRQSQRAARGASSQAPGEFTLISATPSQAQTATGAFTVSWSEQATQSQAPGGQSLPGLAGGSPP